MLKGRIRRSDSPCARGFGLIELMVALVLGLLVATAVIALVLAITKSNRQTIQATRLTQELRATLAVIANDLRRARSVDDPLSVAVAIDGNPYKAINMANAQCVIYGYDLDRDRNDELDEDSWHVIRLDSSTVHLATYPGPWSVPPGTPAPAPPGCATPGPLHDSALGSKQVEITDLRFCVVLPTGDCQATTASGPGDPIQPTDETLVREVKVTITGHLVDSDPTLGALSRTMSQTVFVRSIGTGI